jgi:hypothetical protein
VADEWERHRRYAADGTWDTILSTLLAQADADGKVDWTVSVDSGDLPRPPARNQPLSQNTGGSVESHESAHRNR